MKRFGKYLIGAVLVAAILASCSNVYDEEGLHALPISFYATLDQRITTTENIPDFKVWAYTLDEWGKPAYVMDGVTAVRTGANEWSYSPAAYWPEDKPLSFMAVSPASTYALPNPQWENTIPEYECPGNEDLVISFNPDMLPVSNTIKINFRHVLAQVHVSLRALIPDYTFIIYQVSLRGIGARGLYIYPRQTTYPVSSVEDISAESAGRWLVWDHVSGKYLIYDSPEGTLLSQDFLPCDNQDYSFFIPQKLQPIDYSNAFDVGGSIVDIVYQIYNSQGLLVWPDSTTDIAHLYPDDISKAKTYFQLASGVADSTWLPSRIYNYRLTLTKQ